MWTLFTASLTWSGVLSVLLHLLRRGFLSPRQFGLMILAATLGAAASVSAGGGRG